MNRFENSPTAKIVEFLSTQKPGTTFIFDDFSSMGSYDCVRSSVTRLCKRKELVRLCQGVYMKPGGKVPDAIHLAKEIARRSGSTVLLRNDDTKEGKRILTFLSDGSSRHYILNDGTVIRYIHTDILKK